MSSKIIKGLTVEIGGNTTKLGKAMDNVTKKGRDISSELGQINKLLKLDPGNTELLAQKQKVLADAIENTADELKTLKEAEKQVQKQFERGEVSEAQVRELQREIIQTEKRMESYQKAAKETANQTKKVGDAADEAGEKSGKLGEVLATAGKVAVAGFAAVGAAAAAAVAALAATAEASREYRTEMGKLDTAFTTAGHSSEAALNTYKSLQGVLGETDQAVEAANHLAQLTDNEQDLQKWTKICTGVYATFGASLPIEGLTEAANETAKLGKVTGPLADALNWAGVNEDEFNKSLEACTTEQERQTLIMETLNGLYDEAATKYRETNAEVIRANKANEEWASVMAEVGAAIEPVLTDVKLLGASLVQDLVPGIKEVTEAFRGLLNGEEGAGADLGTAIGDMLGDILTKLTEAIPAVAEAATSLVTSLVEALIANIPLLLEGATTLLMSIVTALDQIIPPLLEALPTFINTLVDCLIDAIPVLTDGAVNFFLAIVDALPLIIPPLVDSIPNITIAIVDALMENLPALVEGAFQFLLAIVQAIPLLIDALLPMIPTIVDSIIDGLLSALPALVDGAVQLFMGILEAIPQICATLIEQGPVIVSSIVSGLLKAIPELIKAGNQLLGGLVKGMMDFDIKGAVKKIGEGVVNGFKKIFDIRSPSRVMAGLGELLDEGLAVGIEDNADAPAKALDKMSEDMLSGADALNGLTLERQVNHSYTADAATPAEGISAKLDQILAAIKRGQVIMLDGKTLVGSTADRYDTELGQRRVLAERGAI